METNFNPQQYNWLTFTKEGEVWAKIVNPYEQTKHRIAYPLMGQDNIKRAYDAFEEHHFNHTYPVNAPSGIEIKGEDVRVGWQWMPSNGDEWLEVEQQDYDKFKTFEGFVKHCSPYRTQTRTVLIYEPKEGVKESDVKPCEILYNLVEHEIRNYKIGDGGLTDLYTLLDKIKKIITEFDPLTFSNEQSK